MSTRASVVVKDGRDMLFFYQHSDGYLEGLGEWLSKFLLTEQAKRMKSDIEYFAAALLMHCNDDYEKTEYPNLVPAVSVHGDESYQYVIDCDTLQMETCSRGSFIIKPSEDA